MLDGLVGRRVGVIEGEHVARADLEFVGDGGDLALDAEVGLEAVPQPRQESDRFAAALQQEREDADLGGDPAQFDQAVELPLFVEAVGPGEQQVRAER
jgi:hypothetical protein